MKFIFSLLVAVIVGSLSCFAADLDVVDHYSFDPVTMSALDYGVSLASATSWDTSDQTNLQNIRDALVSTPSYAGSGSIYRNVDSIQDWIATIGSATVSSSSTASTLLSNLEDINTWLNSSGISDSLEAIDSNFTLNISANEGSLLDTVRDLESLLTTSNSYTATGNGYLYQLVKAIDSDTYNIRDMTQGIWADTGYILSDTNSIDSTTSSLYSLLNVYVPAMNKSLSNLDIESSYNLDFVDNIRETLTLDGVLSFNNSERTLLSRIKQLQEVLASDDDLALANAQKANREEIESSFLSGSSGGMSLGVSDFAGLKDVGGTIKDSLSLDGNATIGSFTSGLAAADSAGQGWFSEETRSQLDAVSSTVTYSLRDPDPYNMAGWEDRYYWLLGDDE